MTQEEKAKAYDEAVREASIAYKDEDRHLKATLERIFPELKKSEDEEIRNWLIGYFHQYKEDGMEEYANGLKVDSIIAWIEKQEKGEIDDDDLATLENWESIVKENKEKWQLSDWFMEATLLLVRKVKHLSKDTNSDVDSNKTMLNACINTLRNIGHQHLANWLKKRKQKETTYDEDMLGAIEYCKKNNRPLEKEHIAWLEKQNEQKQKPTDKFHVGDWVVVRDVVYHIDKISGVYLTLSTLDGTALVYHISVLDSEHTHLWTVSDAKPGDILATEDWIFIFKEIKSNGKPACYCHYDIELGFHIDTNSYIATGSEIYPATKEQRDKLEKAMADAGYTFDFEKKDLKKIENNIILQTGTMTKE